MSGVYTGNRYPYLEVVQIQILVVLKLPLDGIPTNRPFNDIIVVGNVNSRDWALEEV